MRYPDHADPRTYHLFSTGYCGNNAGDVIDHECAGDRENGKACALCVRGGTSRSNYVTCFDNMTKEISPTAVVSTSYCTHYCVYCGQRATTLQRRDYSVRGYTCVCAGACDQREYEATRDKMRQRHRQEVLELEKTAPKQSPQVLAAIWKRETAAILKEIEGGRVPHQLERLGIIIGDVSDS